MTDLLNQIRKAAKNLAVDYHAYCVANEKSDWNGLIVWGGNLLEGQEALGVELMDPDLIRRRIATGKQYLAEEQLAA